MRRATESAIAGFGPHQTAQARAWAARYNWGDATQAYVDTYLQLLATEPTRWAI